jgi:diguanylate cyclase (GGDEF)-like protein
MSIRLRDQLLSETEVEAPPAPPMGLRSWLGLPAIGDTIVTDGELRLRIEQTMSGTKFAVFAAIMALVAIAALSFRALVALDPVALSLAGCALVGLAADFLLIAQRDKPLRQNWSPTRTLTVIVCLGALSTAGWAGAAFHASQQHQEFLTLISRIALLMGLVGSSALPTVCFSRILSGTFAILLLGGASPALLVLALTGLLVAIASMAMTARRQNAIADMVAEHHRGRQSRDLLAAMEASGRGWFWQTNARGRLTYISPGIAERFGSSANDLVGEHFASLLNPKSTSNFDESQTHQSIEFTLGAGVPFKDVIVRAPGEVDQWWSLSGTPIQDHHGRCFGFNGFSADLTQQEKNEADANRLANFDGLTGLPNRVAMRRTLEEMLEDDGLRTPQCGLFLMDLDRFKNVNDTLGHPMGDALLKIVAQRLARVIGNRGKVGRLGGDEFKIIIPDVSDRGALAELADGIIARLSLPYVIDDCTIQIGATIGIAMAPSDGTCPDELTRNADLALYAAKAAGKGVHRFYVPEMHSDANDRRAIENDLREVLVRRELSVLYQPVVDAQSELVCGFEALMRWEHPERGAIPPSVFIPIAEEINLIHRLGDWMIRTACAEAAGWPSHLRVAVNLSPLQFASPSLVSTLVGALAESGLAPERLELEVTEGVLLNEDPAIDKVLASICAMGVRLVLDDFGTGYASLAYLKRVPFSKIKIDRSFVRGEPSTLRRNQAIIRAMVGLAESLDMETVAEGAETLDEVELIRSLGCSQIQGYIFGYPLKPADARIRALASAKTLEQPDPCEREPRLALLRVAQLTSLGHESSVKIRNISAGGALVEAPGNIPIGVDVTLTLTDGWAFAGQVRWRRGNRFGLEFDQPIALDDFVIGNPPPIDADAAETAIDDAEAQAPVPDWLATAESDAVAEKVAAGDNLVRIEHQIQPEAPDVPTLAEPASDAAARPAGHPLRRRA